MLSLQCQICRDAAIDPCPHQGLPGSNVDRGYHITSAPAGWRLTQGPGNGIRLNALSPLVFTFKQLHIFGDTSGSWCCPHCAKFEQLTFARGDIITPNTRLNERMSAALVAYEAHAAVCAARPMPVPAAPEVKAPVVTELELPKGMEVGCTGKMLSRLGVTHGSQLPIGTILANQPNTVTGDATFERVAENQWKRDPPTASGKVHDPRPGLTFSDSAFPTGSDTLVRYGPAVVAPALIVGTTLHKDVKAANLPVGTRLRGKTWDAATAYYEKLGPDAWQYVDGASRTDKRAQLESHLDKHTTKWVLLRVGAGLPEVEAPVLPALKVGESLRAIADMHALPVGTVIERIHPSLRSLPFKKLASGKWTIHFNLATAKGVDVSINFPEWAAFRVKSMGGVPEAPKLERVESVQFLRDLPIGSVIQGNGTGSYKPSGYEYTKVKDQLWATPSESARSSSHMFHDYACFHVVSRPEVKAPEAPAPEVPATPVVGELVPATAKYADFPVGTRVRSKNWTQLEAYYERVGEDKWTYGGSPTAGVGLLDSAFKPVGAWVLTRHGPGADASVAAEPVVGEQLPADTKYADLPIGTVLHYKGSVADALYEKLNVNEWKSLKYGSRYSDANLQGPAKWTLHSLPVVPAPEMAKPTHLSPGDTLTCEADMVALPVGTRIQHDGRSKRVYVKRANGKWRTADGSVDFSSGSFAYNQFKVYGLVTYETSHLMPGDQLSTHAEWDALPVDSVVKHVSHGGREGLFKTAKGGWLLLEYRKSATNDSGVPASSLTVDRYVVESVPGYGVEGGFLKGIVDKIIPDTGTPMAKVDTPPAVGQVGMPLVVGEQIPLGTKHKDLPVGIVLTGHKGKGNVTYTKMAALNSYDRGWRWTDKRTVGLDGKCHEAEVPKLRSMRIVSMPEMPVAEAPKGKAVPAMVTAPSPNASKEIRRINSAAMRNELPIGTWISPYDSPDEWAMQKTEANLWVRYQSRNKYDTMPNSYVAATGVSYVVGTPSWYNPYVPGYKCDSPAARLAPIGTWLEITPNNFGQAFHKIAAGKWEQYQPGKFSRVRGAKDWSADFVVIEPPDYYVPRPEPEPAPKPEPAVKPVIHEVGYAMKQGDFATAPVGTWLRYEGNEWYLKTDTNAWSAWYKTHADGPFMTNMRNSGFAGRGNKVIVEPEWFKPEPKVRVVGDRLKVLEEAAAVPVGTWLKLGSYATHEYAYLKVAANKWDRYYDKLLQTDDRASDGGMVGALLCDVPKWYTPPAPVAGTKFTELSEIHALPVGTWLRSNVTATCTYVKTGDHAWDKYRSGVKDEHPLPDTSWIAGIFEVIDAPHYEPGTHTVATTPPNPMSAPEPLMYVPGDRIKTKDELLVMPVGTWYNSRDNSPRNNMYYKVSNHKWRKYYDGKRSKSGGMLRDVDSVAKYVIAGEYYTDQQARVVEAPEWYTPPAPKVGDTVPAIVAELFAMPLGTVCSPATFPNQRWTRVTGGWQSNSSGHTSVGHHEFGSDTLTVITLPNTPTPIPTNTETPAIMGYSFRNISLKHVTCGEALHNTKPGSTCGNCGDKIKDRHDTRFHEPPHGWELEGSDVITTDIGDYQLRVGSDGSWSIRYKGRAIVSHHASGKTGGVESGGPRGAIAKAIDAADAAVRRHSDYTIKAALAKAALIAAAEVVVSDHSPSSTTNNQPSNGEPDMSETIDLTHAFKDLGANVMEGAKQGVSYSALDKGRALLITKLPPHLQFMASTPMGAKVCNALLIFGSTMTTAQFGHKLPGNVHSQLTDFNGRTQTQFGAEVGKDLFDVVIPFFIEMAGVIGGAATGKFNPAHTIEQAFNGPTDAEREDASAPAEAVEVPVTPGKPAVRIGRTGTSSR